MTLKTTLAELDGLERGVKYHQLYGPWYGGQIKCDDLLRLIADARTAHELTAQIADNCANLLTDDSSDCAAKIAEFRVNPEKAWDAVVAEFDRLTARVAELEAEREWCKLLAWGYVEQKIAFSHNSREFAGTVMGGIPNPCGKGWLYFHDAHPLDADGLPVREPALEAALRAARGGRE